MLIIDASVAVKWFVEEDRSVEAKALMRAGERLSAPRFIILEVAHVLWKLHRRGAISNDTRDRSVGIMQKVFGDGADTDAMAARAVSLMNALTLPVYDCLYLALAEREGASLITADEGQFAAARKARIESRLL